MRQKQKKERNHFLKLTIPLPSGKGLHAKCLKAQAEVKSQQPQPWG